MVDFAKLVSSLIGGGIARTLHETFSRIDCQVSHVELRPSQLKEIEALDQCLVRQDVVVKLPTGGGETTIGLVYLKHQMDRGGNPGVYLVPTVQLVEQVIEESKKIGFCVDA